MELRLAGYLPKRVVVRPDWLHAPAVEDICSVSVCNSPAPDEGVGRRNVFDLYESPDDARLAASGSEWTLFAYKLLAIRYDQNGSEEVWPWPAIAPAPLPTAFRSLGFDVVAADSETGFYPGHSPLSCNSVGERWPVNSHCLLDDLQTAIEAALAFANDLEPVEPGPYYVAEVLRAS